VPTSPAPAERFSTLLLWLSRAVDAQYLAGRLAPPLLVLILNRLRGISQTFARIAARIEAGRYSPRRSAPRPHNGKGPRRPNPLSQGAAWLVKLVPEATAFASQLQFLLADAEMAALLAAAPAPLRRPLRSLCRMLGVAPPPILAPPPSTRPRRPAREQKVSPAPERRNKPQRPRYVFGLRDPPPLPDPA
jgi:hypothetical protein